MEVRVRGGRKREKPNPFSTVKQLIYRLNALTPHNDGTGCVGEAFPIYQRIIIPWPDLNAEHYPSLHCLLSHSLSIDCEDSGRVRTGVTTGLQ